MAAMTSWRRTASAKSGTVWVPLSMSAAAIANAKAAYSRFLELFHGGGFAALRSAGARPQRPLWASLGTKDATYSDVKYVESLVGRETVSTMPESTANAFRDHGRVADTLTGDLDAARSVIADLASIGIDLDEVGDRLLAQGVSCSPSHTTRWLEP